MLRRWYLGTIVAAVALLLAPGVARATTRLTGAANCNGVGGAPNFTDIIDAIFGATTPCPGTDVNGDEVVSAADMSADILSAPPETRSPSPTTGTSSRETRPRSPSW